ncbi:hypothetical protein C1X89_13935 [Pseudomonas sp. GP01-A8]|nr:hypothetical protein C1X90_13460 [Pseudomonas sp. GP01-A9]PMU29362.1 hypothetical protein C1X88_13680 [Pseudomonas sp. GP01-A13]PMU39576.1 hypothetical protein C1X89_13935 [Pseudomonas sp. GP01-A8]PMU74248.1 hypothetical protein C1X81_12845 [Pseudomonas sp. FW215-L2]PMU74663.1 hypothetical protein C1X84_15020 [Pseudomonas sp. GP01-A1]PMU82269.1 hypothetical protein C1X91_15125 [Pseudomonas sp. GP01-A5]PMV02453.1 hypothetical protein C1X83_31075 [Pseudomonas sp. GP01-A4]
MDERRLRKQRGSIVGAGLLAKAVCQSPDALADPPLSRASPLPHFYGCAANNRWARNNTGASTICPSS